MEPTRNLRYLCCLCVCALLASSLAQATTIRPPSFEKLVENSGRIVRAKVQSIEAYSDEYQGRPLVRTAVTLDVVESLDGRVSPGPLTIRFLGGKHGDLIMEVGGMPSYQVGQEVVLFLHPGDDFVCPTVGWGHGQYFIDRFTSGGEARIRRADGFGLASVSQVSVPIHNCEVLVKHDHTSLAAVQGMTLEQFRLAIRAQLEVKEEAR